MFKKAIKKTDSFLNRFYPAEEEGFVSLSSTLRQAQCDSVVIEITITRFTGAVTICFIFFHVTFQAF